MPPKRNPRSKALAIQPQSKTQTESEDGTEEDENMPDSQQSSLSGSFSKSKKRQLEEEVEDVSNEMQTMFECLRAERTQRILKNKKKKLELYTQSSLKTANKRVEDIWKGQQNERTKLHDEFTKQIGAVLNQWESDLTKSKEQEDKLSNLFQQQQKLFQQTRVTQSQRLKTIKQLHDQYMKGVVNLEQAHNDQHGNVQAELKKEMSLLQKKILMDTQQEEMANVRKSLQTMLF